MSSAKQSIETSNLALFEEPKTYTFCDVWGDIAGNFFGQFGAFAGIFFGVRGSDGQWPHAWWAFAFLVNAFVLAYSRYLSKEAKIVRTGNTMVGYNLSGKELWSGTMDKYESISIEKGCLGWKYVVFVRTDEHMQCMKQTHRMCACCIGKQCWFAIREIDQFAADHGLTAFAEP